MKAYTSLEQSKKLAEFLPLESADMAYWKRSYRPNDYVITVHHSKELQEGFEAKCIEYIPCWSLAALLSILSYPSLHKTFAGWRCDSYDKEGKTCKLGENADNPVDTCVEMILKLHEQNII